MVSFGPWIQDPDFPGSPATSFNLNRAKAANVTDFLDPPYLLQESDLELAAANADTAARLGVHDPTLGNEWGMAYSWAYTLSVGVGWKTHWTAASAKRTLTFGPGAYLYVPDDYGFHDPTAIGIEWIDQPYDPEDPFPHASGEQLALTLMKTTRVSGLWEDLTEPGDRELSTDGPRPDTRLVVEDPTGFETTLMEIPPSEMASDFDPIQAFLSDYIADDIDLTPFVEGHGWAGKLKTHVMPTYFGPKGDTEELGGGGAVRYGWGLDNIQFYATCRPPLYRWVYEGTPYRRNIPARGDNLAGGPTRNYPPVKAQQSGRRNVGGFF